MKTIKLILAWTIMTIAALFAITLVALLIWITIVKILSFPTPVIAVIIGVVIFVCLVIWSYWYLDEGRYHE